MPPGASLDDDERGVRNDAAGTPSTEGTYFIWVELHHVSFVSLISENGVARNRSINPASNGVLDPQTVSIPFATHSATTKTRPSFHFAPGSTFFFAPDTLTMTRK